MKFIGPHPPAEMDGHGVEIDCQCARCGSSIGTEDCEDCEDCDGAGVWHRCMSSPDWCEANPLPGREHVKRGEIEWYTMEEHQA